MLHALVSHTRKPSLRECGFPARIHIAMKWLNWMKTQGSLSPTPLPFYCPKSTTNILKSCSCFSGGRTDSTLQVSHCIFKACPQTSGTILDVFEMEIQVGVRNGEESHTFSMCLWGMGRMELEEREQRRVDPNI